MTAPAADRQAPPARPTPLSDGGRVAYVEANRLVVFDPRAQSIRVSEPAFRDGEHPAAFAERGVEMLVGGRRVLVPYEATSAPSPAIAAELFPHPDPYGFEGRHLALVEATMAASAGLGRGLARFVPDPDDDDAPSATELRAAQAHRDLDTARDALACGDPGAFAAECARIADETARGHADTRDPRLLDAALVLSASSRDLLRLYASDAVGEALRGFRAA